MLPMSNQLPIEHHGLPIIVVGAGGHAKVIVDCLRFGGWNVVGCTDSDATPRSCAGAPVIGNDEKLEALFKDGIRHAFCAIGDNAVRQGIGAHLASIGFELPSVCGRGVIISPSVKIGTGAAILPGAVINVDVVIGDFAIINTNSNVDHDCVIGNAAHVGPGAALAGGVRVGDRAFVGTGTSVVPERHIGADAIVGAGSVVIRDILAGAVAYGNPAKSRNSVHEPAGRQR